MTSKEKLNFILTTLIFPECISKEEMQEVFKAIDAIKEDLERLEQIDNANPSEALKCLIGLEKEITQRDGYITNFLKIKFDTIKQALLKAQEQEKLKIDICEMFGLDNLFPYNDTEEILKELEEYMDRRNQLWVDFMKTSKKLKEQDEILEILRKNIEIVDIDFVDENGDDIFKIQLKPLDSNNQRKVREWLGNEI